jgi:hypothetical protein
MLSMLDALAESGFAQLLRDGDTVFAYPTILALHTFGLIGVVGISVVLALRTLGVAADVPLGPLRKYVPVMWGAFWLNAVTGVTLFTFDGRAFATNVSFWVKLAAIVVAVVSVRLMVTRVLGDPAVRDTGRIPAGARPLAITVLVAWTVATTAGRVVAYDPFVQRETAIAVFVLGVVLLAGGFAAVRLMPSLFEGSSATRPPDRLQPRRPN